MNVDLWDASHGHPRLKLLKDEIKKPYFVQLKKFLWDEGVRGVSDSLLPPKVYPPGKSLDIRCHFCVCVCIPY